MRQNNISAKKKIYNMQCCCAFTSERKLGEYFHPPSPRHFQIGFPKDFKVFQKGFQRVLKHFKKVSKRFKRVFKGFPKGFKAFQKGLKVFQKLMVSTGFQKGFKAFSKGFLRVSNPLKLGFQRVSERPQTP